jgi:hypothetical protein
MNPDHAVGGLAAADLSGMLTTCLAYWQGVPADIAASETGLIVLVFGAVAGIAQALTRGQRGSNSTSSATVRERRTSTKAIVFCFLSFVVCLPAGGCALPGRPVAGFAASDLATAQAIATATAGGDGQGAQC